VRPASGNGAAGLTVAVCTYNRVRRLPALVAALRAQDCPVPFEILIVDNNSTDRTAEVLAELAARPGVPLRRVAETRQGIAHARNRAVAEAADSEYLVFMDDDELPRPGWLAAALRCFEADPEVLCVGGRVKVDFAEGRRPDWLGDELLGFLAETDYGDRGFRIADERTPVWTANVAYRMALFRGRPELRFDTRYNREGKGVGGGEDVILFRRLLRAGVAVRYCPDMVVDHAVEPWRLHRRYFLRVHYASGFRTGRWELARNGRRFLGVPLFLFGQGLGQSVRLAAKWMRREPGVLRQAMNVAHALGMIAGCHAAWREGAGGVPLSLN
jgi:glycosyltransferase involved in cell wall biosynthesis